MIDKDESAEYPHRGVMRGLKDYAPIQKIVISVIGSGCGLPYERISSDLRTDPLVVTINEMARFCDFDRSLAEEAVVLTHSFSDTTLTYEKDGRSRVKLIDIYSEFRDDFTEMDVRNQFELGLLLSLDKVDTDFDSVDLDSLDSRYQILHNADIEKEEAENPAEEDERLILDIDEYVGFVREYLSSFPGQNVSEERIYKNLNFSPAEIDAVRVELTKRDDIVFADGYYRLVTESTNVSRETTSDKTSSAEAEEQSDLDRIQNFLSDKDYVRVSSLDISRILSIPDYTVNKVFDELASRGGYEVSPYGIMKTARPKPTVTEPVQIKTVPDTVPEPVQIKTVNDEPLPVQEKIADRIIEKANDRGFIMNLFDKNVDYMPLGKIIGTFYRKNQSSKVVAEDIRQILASSPYSVEKNGMFRPVLCDLGKFGELCSQLVDPNFEDFSKHYESNLSSFRAMGFEETSEAFQTFGKICSAGDTLQSTNKTECELATDVGIEEPEISTENTLQKESESDFKEKSDITQYVIRALRDHRSRSVDGIHGILKKKFETDIEYQDLKKYLDWMSDKLLIFKETENYYRYATDIDIVSKTESFLKKEKECIYRHTKLFLKYRSEFATMDVRTVSEMMQILKKIDRIVILDGEMVCFDGIGMSDMIYDKDHSIDELANVYGIPKKFLEFRKF